LARPADDTGVGSGRRGDAVGVGAGAGAGVRERGIGKERE
jgi:hypothetical protein